MQRLLICIILNCVASQPLFSQAFEWANQISGTTYEDGHSIATDSAGNVYTTGYFQHTLESGGNIPNLISAGGTPDIFIQKTDPQGKVLWAKQVGGAGTEDALALTLDRAGNILITGRFSETVDFDPGPDSVQLHATGAYDAYVLKLDNDGNFVWVRHLAGNFVILGNKIVSSSNGAVYVVGDFNGLVDFDPGAGQTLLEAMGNWMGFILKLDAAGNFNWVKQIGETYASSLQGLALDRQGALITTGWFKTQVDFDPGPGTANLFAVASYDIFVLKLDTAGNFIWVRSMGGGGWDLSYDLKVDDSGNILVAGTFETTVDFDPGPGVFNLTVEGSTDIFIEKLSPAGNFLWAKRIGAYYTDQVFALDLDDSGNVYATGKVSGPVDFDPGPNTLPQSFAAGYGTFLLKLDFLGELAWATPIGGGGQGNDIAVDRSGFVYATGNFTAPVMMNPGDSSTILVPVGTQDIFIIKQSQEWNFQGTVYHDLNENGMRDAGESGVRGVTMQAQDKQKYATTNALGEYHFYDNLLGDTVRALLPWASWTTMPLFTIPDSAETAMDFAAQGPLIRDVCLASVEMTAFRPGFETEVVIQLTNVGMVAVDTVPVRLLLVAPGSPLQLELLSAEPVPVAQTAQEISWVTGALDVNQTFEIRVRFRTPASLPIGTEVVLSTTALLEYDAFEPNNSSRIQAVVVGSFDPNDKACTPSTVAPQGLDTTDLRYVIRFQNTGTFPADFVVIRDTLPAGLDLAMLKVLGASHPYTWRWSGPRVLEFRFEQINLPDSTANEPASHGFVAFTVRAQPGLAVGDSISNRAGIYFDYNAPVITNSALMKVAIISKIHELVAHWIDFGLNPNPAAPYSAIAVELPPALLDQDKKVIISTMQGKRVREVSLSPGELRTFLRGLVPGVYLVQVSAGTWFGAKVLVVP